MWFPCGSQENLNYCRIDTWQNLRRGKKCKKRALYDIGLGVSMVSIININNNIKEPTSGYQYCDIGHIYIDIWWIF